MILPVYLYGQPVLRKVAEDITSDYKDLPELIKNMYETMYKSEGIGLAAPQIGLNIRLIVIDADVMAESYPECKDFKIALINPRILDKPGNNVSYEEGCLSLPGIHESVTRPDKVTVSYLDENFQPQTKTFEGFQARVVQHEYDHLEGMMFIDRISLIRKQLIKSKLNNIVKGKIKCDYRTKAVSK